MLVLVLLAAGAYFWVTGMMDATFAFRSPLKNTAPAAAQPANERLTRRVVFVLIDALREDTSRDAEVMPVLNGLRKKGAWSVMHSQPPSFSQPGYTTLLTGAWPMMNDGPVVNVDYSEIWTFTQDNLFSAAHRAGLTTAISGYNWFEKLVPQGDVTMSFYTAGEDKVADREVVDAALPWLKEDKSQLVLIHIDQVDYAGHHEGGPRDPHWNEAAARADQLLGEIVSTLDFNQDTLFICSDHGQIDRGGHGGQDEVTLVEPFVLVGKGVRPGQYKEVQMVDVSSTLAVLLGANLPASALGHAQLDMLTLQSDQISAIQSADREQKKGLTDAYLQAIHSSQADLADNAIWSAIQQRLTAERLLRGGAALFVAGLLAFGLWKLVGRNLLWFGGSGLIYLGVFNLRYLILDGRTYSLSSVGGASELIVYTAVTALVAFLVAAGFAIWRTGLLSGGKMAAAVGMQKFTFALLYLLALPVLWSFFWNGWKPVWMLPDYLSAFLALIFGVQILVVALVGGLSTGAAALAAPRK